MQRDMDYDEEYTRTAELFGPSPERTLVRFWHLLERGRPVLDVGCGQGRNALYLARKGIRVDALDPSRVAVRSVEETARREDLPVRTVCGRFLDLGAEPASFDGVLVLGLVPDLPRPLVDELLPLVHAWSAPAGLLWLTVFTTADPCYENHATHWTPVGRNSFQSPQGQVRTYLEPMELRSLFSAFEVVHYWEGLGPQHRHGGGPVERHAMAEAVFRKPE